MKKIVWCRQITIKTAVILFYILIRLIWKWEEMNWNIYRRWIKINVTFCLFAFILCRLHSLAVLSIIWRKSIWCSLRFVASFGFSFADNSFRLVCWINDKTHKLSVARAVWKCIFTVDESNSNASIHVRLCVRQHAFCRDKWTFLFQMSEEWRKKNQTKWIDSAHKFQFRFLRFEIENERKRTN